jgi:hypothetical protein
VPSEFEVPQASIVSASLNLNIKVSGGFGNCDSCSMAAHIRVFGDLAGELLQFSARPHQAMNNQMPMAVWRAGMDKSRRRQGLWICRFAWTTPTAEAKAD